MTFEKEKVSADELSQMIDELNKGNKVDIDDSETSQLINVASMVKLAAGRPNSQQQALDFLAGQLGDGTNSKKHKHRMNWLYSGAVSAAAAVFLVVATNLMPLNLDNGTVIVSPEMNISQVMPLDEPLLNSEDPQERVDTKAIVPPTVRTEKKDEIAPAANAESKKTANVPIEKPAPVTEVTQQREKTVPSADTANKSIMVAKVQNEKQSVGLSLPGRNAAERTVDSALGVVKQTYSMDNREVVISHKTKTKTGDSASKSDSVRSAGTSDKNAAKDGVNIAAIKANKITTAAKDHEVTVEGDLPNDELQKVAESLVETDD